MTARCGTHVSSAVVIIGAATLCAAAFQPQDAGVVRGAALYAERCAVCHGADAKGLNGPNLTNLTAAGRTDDGSFKPSGAVFQAA